MGSSKVRPFLFEPVVAQVLPRHIARTAAEQVKASGVPSHTVACSARILVGANPRIRGESAEKAWRRCCECNV